MRKIKLKCSGSFLFLSHCGLSVKSALRNGAPAFGRFRVLVTRRRITLFFLTSQQENRQNNNMQQEVESTTFP